jgi:hypothetical protein
MSDEDLGKDNTPFFIVGCPRSGTTMLRDLLRRHPRLECPEETHFFRWADPFGSPRYDEVYDTMDVFRRHHEADHVSDEDFDAARRSAKNRREMADAYGRLYLAAVNNPAGRWFDKTPQNVYGLFLLSYMYPEARFVHIHRNPLNVAASLAEGRVMAKHGVKGAVNYWMEAMILINEYKKLGHARLLELPYEGVASDPVRHLRILCDFLREDAALLDIGGVEVHPERNLYRTVLSEDDIRYVLDNTSPFLSLYGYG